MVVRRIGGGYEQESDAKLTDVESISDVFDTGRRKLSADEAEELGGHR